MRREKKNQARKFKAEASEKFKVAGGYFEQINLYTNAAQCYYSSGDYEKAGEVFEKNHDFQQSAECLRMVGNFF